MGIVSLDALVAELSPLQVLNLRDVEVSDVVCRPEEATSQVAYGVFDEYLVYGQWVHGHDVLGMLAGLPALFITEKALPGLDVPQLIVKDARRATAIAARRVHGRPDEQLKVIGVTGTKGKTTTVNLIRQCFNALGAPCTSLGTLGMTLPDLQTVQVGYTTPIATDLYRAMRQALDAGSRYFAMEVSSHALALERTHGLRYAQVVFTNLGRDHLDFHGTEKAYGEAKALLFAQDCPGAVVNTDDPFGKQLAASARARRVLPCGFGEGEGLRAQSVLPEGGATVVDLHLNQQSVRITSALLGHFNVYNLLSALGCALNEGFDLATVAKAAAQLQPVTGRMETLNLPSGVVGVVDFAHTAESLEQLLMGVRTMVTGRIVLVFGCGGDRDKGKRPLMGAVAERLADYVILTSDNPRTEPEEQIIKGIADGFSGTKFSVQQDRAKAIREGFAMCREGDILVVAGKGHEQTQIFAGHVEPFSDRSELERLNAH